MATSFSGTRPKWRTAMRAPVSMEVPKRLMPSDFPLSCSGFSISGRTMRCCTNVSMVVPTIMTSAPPKAALAVVLPAICRNWTSPAIKALMPSTPLGVAMTSTSRPCLAKIPAERAIHGGIIDPDNEVNAIRSLRRGGESAALERPGTRSKTNREIISAMTRIVTSLPSVKSFGVFAQDSCFGLLGDVLAAADGRNDIGKNSVPVRVVGGEKNFVVADALDHIGKSFLLRLRREEPIALFDVLAGFFLTKRRFHLSPLLPFFIHPLDPIGNPTNTAFEKRYSQFRKSLRNAPVHQAGELDEGLHRPADGMHVNKAIETFLSSGSFAPIMNAERDVEPLELLVDGPENLRTQVFFHSLSGDGDSRKAELTDRTVSLLYCRCRILKRK